MDSRYQDLNKNVVGSGADALKLLPPEMQRKSTGVKEVRHMETVTPTTFRLNKWQEGIRLTKGHINAEDLKYQDLYEYFQKNREAKALKESLTGQKQSEFGDFTVTNKHVALVAVGLGLFWFLTRKRK